MAEKNQFDPDYCIPPGSFIAEELKARGWSRVDLVNRMPGDRADNGRAVHQLIGGPNPLMSMTGELARRLGEAFGQSAELWMNLDRQWREGHARGLTKMITPASAL